MNCQKNDLAYIRVPDDWPDKIINGKFVTVGVEGSCDLCTFAPAWENAWLCEFHVPWYSHFIHGIVRKCYVLDSWLRPIRGDLIEDDVHDEVTA
jgi:hypothetical protein